MGGVREIVATPAPGGERLVSLRERAGAWLGRHDVRVALAAALGLRVATSVVVALLALGLSDIYRSVMAQMNARAPELGISLVPVPLDGPAGFLTGPWLRWDANNYLLIARGGYTFSHSSAFMPLYPLLVRIGSYVMGGHYVASALLASTSATFVAFLQLHRLVERLALSARVADFAILVACLLPIAFFFVAPYSEALFLALSLGCILAALDRKWVHAALLAALATLARQQGILLGLLALPALWEALRPVWRADGPRATRLRAAWEGVRGPALLPLASAGAYAMWLAVLVFWLHVPTPTQVLTSRQGWNQHFTLPGLGALVDLSLVLKQPENILVHHLSVPLDALAALICAALLIVAWHRLPPALRLYLLACWCAALVKVQPGGETVSAARYLLAALPLAIVPATWLARGPPALRLGYVALSFLLWSVFLSEWVLWSWVN